MIFSDPSRIVLQTMSLWEEYIRLHHPIEETRTTNDPSLGSLVNTRTIMSTTLQKGKVVLQTQDVGQSHVHRNMHRRSTLSLLDGCHQTKDDSNLMLILLSL